MGNLVKNLLKYVAYKIYVIGKNQFDLIHDLNNDEKLPITKDVSSRLLEGCLITNNQKDKSKIIIGKMSWVQGHLLVFKQGGLIIIGDYSYVGKDSRIWSAQKISIGNRVFISHNVNIMDNNTHPFDPAERHQDFVNTLNNKLSDNLKLNEREIIVEDDAWIGFNCTILKGVVIGKGAIVGANTLITKDVPPYSVVIGNPQKVIKYINHK